MGFADRPTGGSFVGEIMDPEPVSVKDDGLLLVATEFQPAL
jgi:beta-fructofuranosidase